MNNYCKHSKMPKPERVYIYEKPVKPSIKEVDVGMAVCQKKSICKCGQSVTLLHEVMVCYYCIPLHIVPTDFVISLHPFIIYFFMCKCKASSSGFASLTHNAEHSRACIYCTLTYTYTLAWQLWLLQLGLNLIVLLFSLIGNAKKENKLINRKRVAPKQLCMFVVTAVLAAGIYIHSKSQSWSRHLGYGLCHQPFKWKMAYNVISLFRHITWSMSFSKQVGTVLQYYHAEIDFCIFSSNGPPQITLTAFPMCSVLARIFPKPEVFCIAGCTAGRGHCLLVL